MRVVATYRVQQTDDETIFGKDDEADRIFKMFAGQSLGRGLMLATRERDIEYEVPDGLASAAADALIRAGFRVECP